MSHSPRGHRGQATARGVTRVGPRPAGSRESGHGPRGPWSWASQWGCRVHKDGGALLVSEEARQGSWWAGEGTQRGGHGGGTRAASKDALCRPEAVAPGKRPGPEGAPRLAPGVPRRAPAGRRDRVAPAQPQGPCPSPRPQLGSSCLRLSPAPLITPTLLPELFAPNGKYLISIICEAPRQMTLIQHGKDLSPLDPAWESGSREGERGEQPEGTLLGKQPAFTWARINPRNPTPALRLAGGTAKVRKQRVSV